MSALYTFWPTPISLADIEGAPERPREDIPSLFHKQSLCINDAACFSLVIHTQYFRTKLECFALTCQWQWLQELYQPLTVHHAPSVEFRNARNWGGCRTTIEVDNLLIRLLESFETVNKEAWACCREDIRKIIGYVGKTWKRG